MLTDLSSPLGTICVLDIETALDPVAVSLVPGRPQNMPKALLRVTGASLLWAIEDRAGWTVEKIDTAVAIEEFTDEPEEEILELFDHAIGRIVKENGMLLSFNGLAHDLPIIRRRAARHLRFDLENVLTRQPRHLDLMLGSTRPDRSNWPNLIHSAVGLGLPHGVLQRNDRLVSFESQKSESDVVTTFLLFLVELSMRKASEEPLLLGWAALADRIEAMGARGRHLMHFARHDMAEAAQQYRSER